MIEIPLTQGQITYVDDMDGDLAAFNWHAVFQPTYAGGGLYMASRWVRCDGKKQQQRIHTVILSRILDRELVKGEIVDHVDRNPLNNKRENLRLATRADNSRNANFRKDNSSGFKGVSWHKLTKSWTVQININSKRTCLGRFADPIQAAKVYDSAAREHFGEFAVLNFPDSV